MSELSYRDYKDGDKKYILDLFIKCFGRQLNPVFWEWRFLDNPNGKAIIKLMFDDERLVGHYAVIPMIMQIGFDNFNCALSMTTMTDPEYSGRGIFSKLAEETYNECINRGIKFVYGFPNVNSLYGFTKKLGWLDLGEMNVFYRRLEKIEFQEFEDIISVSNFDEKLDEFWNKINQNFKIIVPRTKDFLNWRFVKHPDINYKLFLSIMDNNIQGYVILKIFESCGIKKGHLVDFVYINDENFSRLLSHAYNYFTENDVFDISCWVPPSIKYHKSLLDHGFSVKSTTEFFGTPTFFGIKPIDNSFMGELTIKDNWFITMGDSDVF